MTLTINLSEREIIVDRRLGVAIQEAIENAAKHTGMEPTIQISVEIDEDREQVWIDIEDDGPGIPDHELQVMSSGAETPLTHGSGIGLWFIYWVVDNLGGEMTIQCDDPDGTVVSMAVPLETEQNNPELRNENHTIH